MKWLGAVLDVIGIGGKAIARRQQRKQIKLESELRVIEAKANAKVNRINSNTTSDNQIDLITAEQKDKTFKDDFVTYLFLIPVAVATFQPFLVAYKTDTWDKMNKYFLESYESLNQLPDWYKIAVILVVVDVLGFRSFLRKAFTALIDNYMAKKGLIKKVSEHVSK